MENSTFKQDCSKILNNKGQSIIEFVLLLLVVMSISLGFQSIFKIAIKERWKSIVKVIVAPSTGGVEFVGE